MTDNARRFFDLDALCEQVKEWARNAVRAELAEQVQPQSQFLTIPEAAQLLRCKRQRVDDLLSAGRLTRVRDGSRVLIERAELMRYLAGERTGPRSVAPALPRTRRSRSQTGVAR